MLSVDHVDLGWALSRLDSPFFFRSCHLYLSDLVSSFQTFIAFASHQLHLVPRGATGIRVSALCIPWCNRHPGVRNLLFVVVQLGGLRIDVAAEAEEIFHCC